MATTFKEIVKEGLKLGKVKIGFGLAKPDKNILDSLRKGKEYADIVLVGPKEIKSIKDFDKIISDESEKKLSELLVKGEFEAIIRGTIDDFKTIETYGALIGKEKIKNMVVLCLVEDFHGRQFFTTSGSNPFGWTIEEKIKQCEDIIKFMKNELGIEPKIGLITGRRHETYQRNKDIKEGVDAILNKTYEDANKVVEYFSKKRIKAKNYGIEIETAVAEGCNIIVPPNGIVGNQIFRTLILIGGGKLLTASMGNLPHIFENNSRSEKDFLPHVKWVVAWANRRKYKKQKFQM